MVLKNNHLYAKNDHLSQINIQCSTDYLYYSCRWKGSEMMQVEIKIDGSCKEPKVIILTDKVTDEINEILRKISEEHPQAIAGFKNEILEILEPNEIIRIFTANQKVYAQTDKSEYLLRLRLYEIEQRLDKNTFARISNSEIINLKKVKNMDLSFSGTICVNLHGNTKTFVSRRYVSKIKQILGI